MYLGEVQKPLLAALYWRWLLQKVNELVKQTMRGSLAVHAWLPLRVSISLALKKPQKLREGTLYLSAGSF
jgi:hypothetical protein